jgi:hypothetical protein
MLIVLKSLFSFEKTGGGNDELNDDAGKLMKLLIFIEHGLL